jgi:hypothetical protein
MSWKQALGLSLSAFALALILYGLFFAKPRWVDVRIEPVGSVRIL